MGNILNSIFGTSEDNQRTNDVNRYARQIQIERSNQNQQTFNRTHYQNTIRIIPKVSKPRSSVTKINRNDAIINKLCDLQKNDYINNERIFFNNSYGLEHIHTDSWEYKTIERLFLRTNNKCFKIDSILRVENKYLMIQYNLKKQEYYRRGIQYEEKIMFHGTKESNIIDICETNFDWRLNGSANGTRFGKGIYFSPNAFYCTHYGDKTYNKVMIATKVIVGNTCLGIAKTIIPPSGYDTTTNKNNRVYCKYEDNMFYPAYLIYYSGFFKKNTNINIQPETASSTSSVVYTETDNSSEFETDTDTEYDSHTSSYTDIDTISVLGDDNDLYQYTYSSDVYEHYY